MKLSQGTLRPARVVEVLENGKIKVDAPGLFAEEDAANCPPIYPFFGGHENSYSSVKRNDEVWVMSFDDNPYQLHWIRKDNFSGVNDKFINDEEVEIFMNKDTSIGNAILMYSNSIGWLMSLNGSSISIDPNGGISIDPNGGKLELKNADISTGDKSVAYGETMYKICCSLVNYLKLTADSLKTNMLTTIAAAPLESLSSEIEKELSNIESTAFKIR